LGKMDRFTPKGIWVCVLHVRVLRSSGQGLYICVGAVVGSQLLFVPLERSSHLFL